MSLKFLRNEIWNPSHLINPTLSQCVLGYQPPSPPPQKHHLLLSCQAPLPLKSVNCPSSDFSENPQNIKRFSSLIPSYLLKVTKFLGEISQFEFLVMTEKNIFSYKLSLSLNISDLNLFCENCTLPPPPEKLTPSFPATPI